VASQWRKNTDAATASSQFYTGFSLLKSMEAGFGLPCLNHACDSNVQVMSDRFLRY
jgi:phosphatidylinositol-3-phosphatase